MSVEQTDENTVFGVWVLNKVGVKLAQTLYQPFDLKQVDYYISNFRTALNRAEMIPSTWETGYLNIVVCSGIPYVTMVGTVPLDELTLIGDKIRGRFLEKYGEELEKMEEKEVTRYFREFNEDIDEIVGQEHLSEKEIHQIWKDLWEREEYRMGTGNLATPYQIIPPPTGAEAMGEVKPRRKLCPRCRNPYNEHESVCKACGEELVFRG